MCDNVDSLPCMSLFFCPLRGGVDFLKEFTWHAGGYSGTPVDSAFECAQAEGFEHVLCAAWHIGDNSGPHNVSEVRLVH